jgi:hypothetical protein
MKRISSKDITLKTGGKFFSGVTDVNYDSSAVTERSLIKEDGGVEQEEIVAFQDNIDISGVVCVNEAGDETDHQDWAAIRTAYRAKAKVAFVYGMFSTGKPEITGNLQILSYSEKSGSNGKATYSMKAKILQDDDLTFGTTAA